MIPPLDDENGRQSICPPFIQKVRIDRAYRGLMLQEFTAQGKADISQITTLENVNLDSLCDNCCEKWWCERLTCLVSSELESGE